MPRMSANGSTWKQTFQAPEGGPYRTACSGVKFTQAIGAYGVSQAPVQCGKCKHCRWSRRQAMATAVEMELARSDWALWVTLTIAPHPDRATDLYDKVIQPKLMQHFQKRCRINQVRKVQGFKGRNCTSWRYIQCGEYGELRGRAHYHCVIFGKGDKPTWGDRSAEMIHIPEWKWGHVNVSTEVDRGVAFYLAKYMQKNGAKSWSSASNRTAIGGAYILDRGRVLAENCLLPAVHWVFQMTGRKALIRGAKRRYLFQAFCQAKGVELLSLARHLAPGMHGSLVSFERHAREKAANVKPHHVLTRERIKRETWRDLRIALGIPPDQASAMDRPIRPRDWSPPPFIGNRDYDGSVHFPRRAAHG